MLTVNLRHYSYFLITQDNAGTNIKHIHQLNNPPRKHDLRAEADIVIGNSSDSSYPHSVSFSSLIPIVKTHPGSCMISYKELYVFSFKGVCHQAKICETAGSMKFTSNMRKRDLKKKLC